LINNLNKPLLRFGLCSGLATLSHWMVMGGLIWLTLNPAVATAVGALVGAVVNYLLQYHFVFSCSKSHFQTLVSYVLSCSVGWAANLSLFSLLYLWWPDQVALIQFITTSVVAFLNYFLYRRVVFNDGISANFAN